MELPEGFEHYTPPFKYYFELDKAARDHAEGKITYEQYMKRNEALWSEMYKEKFIHEAKQGLHAEEIEKAGISLFELVTGIKGAAA